MLLQQSLIMSSEKGKWLDYESKASGCAGSAGENEATVAFIKCCSSSLGERSTGCSQWMASIATVQRMRWPCVHIRLLPPMTRKALAFFSLLLSLSATSNLVSSSPLIILALSDSNWPRLWDYHPLQWFVCWRSAWSGPVIFNAWPKLLMSLLGVICVLPYNIKYMLKKTLIQGTNTTAG